MSRWLARFSFSLVVIAAVLVWQGYQTATGRRGEPSLVMAIVWFAGATIFLILGFIGLRERHRPRHYDS